MRKIIIRSFLGLVFLWGINTGIVHAAKIAFSLDYGFRQLSDENLGEIYGDGYVFNPGLSVSLSPFFSVQASYEGGYKRSAPIGIYNEPSTLKVGGFELSGIFKYRFNFVQPYIKAGGGYYSYVQDIESEFLRMKVDHHAWGTFIGGGFDLFIYEGLYLLTELKFVSLKVQPFDIEVDLSGLRVLFGMGYEFDLRK